MSQGTAHLQARLSNWLCDQLTGKLPPDVRNILALGDSRGIARESQDTSEGSISSFLMVADQELPSICDDIGDKLPA